MVTYIQENVARVEERIRAACHRSGRRREDIRLVAVSKTHPPQLIRAAFEAGLRDFGENRVQEAESKRPELDELDATWHLIGHLQSNKAKAARALFDWVHSLDSLHLAQKLAQAADSSGARLPVLIEVNLGGETSKAGIGAREAAVLAQQVVMHATLELRGLMTIPPFRENPEDVRSYFGQLRALAIDIEKQSLPKVSLPELSMGMSHDLEVAIEEGATIVRVGTAIFGDRP
jgi:PLP dependent protein